MLYPEDKETVKVAIVEDEGLFRDLLRIVLCQQLGIESQGSAMHPRVKAVILYLTENCRGRRQTGPPGAIP